MAEWSIALPWKGSNWATGSGVRIPVSPPILFNSFLVNLYVEGSSITTSQNLNDVLTFFMGDIIGTTLVFIVLAIILKPLFVRNNKINHSR